ncbi:MAG: hypothetical protein WD184_08425 [Acidimicrobiia bacterium]
MVSELRSEADRAVFTDLTERAVALGLRPRLAGRLRTRLATVAASITLAFGGLGGVAFAANGSAPGDFLYGVDRALERVGLGSGGSAERLGEVTALIERGDTVRGLQHATESLLGEADDAGSEAARLALLAAADRIAAVGDTGPPVGVADLLTYLSDNIDAVDGLRVAELAGAIGEADGDSGPPDENPGPPDSTPGGPPDGTPGDDTSGPPVEQPGPPNDKPDPSDDAGPPDIPPDPPDDAGPPGTTP